MLTALLCKRQAFVFQKRSWISTGWAAISSLSNAAQLLKDKINSAEPQDKVQTEIYKDQLRILNLRNIGISAHIDSGKTTLTERILFYTGRISSIHEVRGKDGVGAKMDSMELEREKGITIKSAATYCFWKENNINIIDTPGHVDFTIEVERALRVLDSAVLVVCAVSGVQSQTLTVNRQMKRYKIPRLCFINKLDRMGANPFTAIQNMRKKLGLNAAAVQVPIGLEEKHRGLVDILSGQVVYFEGSHGQNLRYETSIPEALIPLVKEKYLELIECVANVDEEIGDYFLNEKEPPLPVLKAAIRRATLEQSFFPVFMGSAYKNIGIQLLLDGVSEYLPNPSEVTNTAFSTTPGSRDASSAQKTIDLVCDSEKPLVCLAFKLEEGRFGQLTYIRIYQGRLTKGTMITNSRTDKKLRVPRIVRLHSDEMEDVSSVGAGEICALFGVECSTGDTFTSHGFSCSLSNFLVPDPVISLSISPKTKDHPSYSKALSKFLKEDPTFRMHYDSENKETIISGMGELHLEIYIERLKREYSCEVITGKPRVAFRETISSRASFDYTHKKQSGGSGQYARVIGYIEPILENIQESGTPVLSQEQTSGIVIEGSSLNLQNIFENEFVNKVIGGTIPTCYIPSCEKGFDEECQSGPLIGHPLVNTRFVLQDGQAHVVDSNELSFRIATTMALRQAIVKAKPIILEPIMKLYVLIPLEFQGIVMAGINKRKGVIIDTESTDDTTSIISEIPLNEMFGYSSELRGCTQGKGEFSLEYKNHAPVMASHQETMISQHQKAKQEQLQQKK